MTDSLMIDRRRFLQCIAAAAATPAAGCAAIGASRTKAQLLADRKRIIDLPDGFSYTVLSKAGEPMSDGLPTPGDHDGMAAFSGENGRIVLVRNHELGTRQRNGSRFERSYRRMPEATKAQFYDRGRDVSPCMGGTTTTIYNPDTGVVEKQFLSLAGTKYNCAGGKTPWGSWLTCEESFEDPGASRLDAGDREVYEVKHGYIFEVPASAMGPVTPVPLKAMGRFEHEAAAVHAASGVVYLTEDQWHSLFYRFVPNVPGQLHKGGRLQALAVAGEPAKNTHNWDAVDMTVKQPLETYWIDLDDVDGDENDLRLRGAAAGAATFARGEGLTEAGEQFAFTCTIGGPARLGQVFSYTPSPYEGTDREKESPGKLSLIAEADDKSLFKNCDNLTMAPWGDLIVCEDTVTAETCSLVGVRPDGSQYYVADNRYSDSELAGVCFSPDGQVLFLNIQYPGMTVAITGPWQNLSS